MKRRDCLLHLIGEISSFILTNDPSRMVISLHQEDDGVHLCVIDNHPRTDYEIQTVRESLNGPARPELAAYYGSMAGLEPLGNARLKLIGWQVKHADVERCDKGIKIDLWMGSERFNADYFNIPVKKEKKVESASRT